MNKEDLRRSTSTLRCAEGHDHGFVMLEEIKVGGPVHVHVHITNIAPGYHGFHIHQSGNASKGPKSLCAHYNPFKKDHGGRNDLHAHLGDLGNVYADKNSNVEEEFIAKYVRLRGEHSVLGRSFVVHEDEDDLGQGKYDDSKTTGHSGKRILWGIIGIYEDC